jgi:cell fate regulator YaaT (PSP1 superfamily)
MTRLVTIKFRTAGKQYHFNAGELELSPGQAVIVETERGRALGTVVTPPREVTENETPENLKKILRVATTEDIAQAENSAAREKEAFRFCLERIKSRQMDMKLVRAEYLFDGSKIIFFFTADGRIDFRELVKDLAHYFHTRIEMRQIGVRDEAKLIGGIGICGRSLCCCTFLTDFVPVSVKMAKEQGLALNPSKISGQCGRLLCCLNYEYKTYLSLKQQLPKCGKQVKIEGQEGEIVGQNVLDQTITVKLDENQQVEVPLDKVEISDTREKPSPPEEAPASRKRSRGSSRPRKGPRSGDDAKTAHSGEQKPAQTSSPAPPAETKRREGKPVRRGGTAPQENESGAPKRPRRKNRPRNRSPKNPPSGDKS